MTSDDREREIAAAWERGGRVTTRVGSLVPWEFEAGYRAALAAREEPAFAERMEIRDILAREDTERPDIRTIIAAVGYLFADQLPEDLLETLGDADDD